MKDFREYLITERKKDGLDFEPCLVALIMKDKEELKNFDNSLISKAKSAASHLPKSIKFACKCGTGKDSISINMPKGVAGSPKTDIFLDTKKSSNPKYHVSVKLDGSIQLTSLNGKTASKVFKVVAENTLFKNLKMKKHIENEVVSALESMGSRFVDGSKSDNVAKVKEKNPSFYKEAFNNKGQLKKDYDYKAWEEQSRSTIIRTVVNSLNKSDEFRNSLTEELLTGKITFASSPLAVANSLLTPNEFYSEINDKVISLYSSLTTYTVTAKSVHGVSSPNFRAITENTKTGTPAEIEKAIERAYNKNKKWLVEEFGDMINYSDGNLVICEGFWDKIKEFGKNIWNKIIEFFDELLSDIKNSLIDWYKSHSLELTRSLFEDDSFVLNLGNNYI